VTIFSYLNGGRLMAWSTIGVRAALLRTSRRKIVFFYFFDNLFNFVTVFEAADGRSIQIYSAEMCKHLPVCARVGAHKPIIFVRHFHISRFYT
jgi:hypothetical protein